MNVSLEKIEIFRKLIADNSNYTKLCSKEEIEILKKHYSEPVFKQKYLKTKSKYLKVVLNFYKMYNLKLRQNDDTYCRYYRPRNIRFPRESDSRSRCTFGFRRIWSCGCTLWRLYRRERGYRVT